MNENPGQTFKVSVSWDSQYGVPVPANQFAIVQGPNAESAPSPLYELHLGYVTAPLLPAVEAGEEFSDVQNLHLVIHRVGHVQISIDFMRQMKEMLGNMIDSHDGQLGLQRQATDSHGQ